MLKALVVEDEEDIKQLLVDELEDRGYQVQEAGNGVCYVVSFLVRLLRDLFRFRGYGVWVRRFGVLSSHKLLPKKSISC